MDTREQRPFSFSRYAAVVTRGTLKTGDYSPTEFADLCAVERKSLDDLIGSLTTGRDRFEREMERLSHYECGAVICEGSFEDLIRGRYTSKALPHSMAQSCIALSVRFKIPFLWAGSRDAAEYLTFWTIQKFLAEKSK